MMSGGGVAGFCQEQGAGFLKVSKHRSDTASTCQQSQTCVCVSIQHKTFLQVVFLLLFFYY